MHSRFQNNTRHTIFNLCTVWSLIIVSVYRRKWECDLIPWRRQTSEGTPHLRIWPSASTIWYYIDGLCTDPVSFFINGCCLPEWYRMILYALISLEKNSTEAPLKNRFPAEPHCDVIWDIITGSLGGYYWQASAGTWNFDDFILTFMLEVQGTCQVLNIHRVWAVILC